MSTEEVLRISLSPEVTHDHPPAVPIPGRIIHTSGIDAVVYPRWFYVRDRLGRYLTVRPSVSSRNGNITFRSGEPDIYCTFEAIKSEYWPEYFNFRNKSSGSYVSADHYWDSKSQGALWYLYITTSYYEAKAFHTITGAGDSKVYWKDYPWNNVLSNHLTDAGSPILRDFVNLDSEMEIIAAAVKSEIVDVEYDIPDAKVREEAPLIALSTSVRNDSNGDVNQNVSYTYEKWKVGTWNNVAGVELGGKMSFTARVPFIASTELEIALSAAFSHEWGGEEGVKEIITSSTTVTVPPRKKARATIVIRNAQIDVGFTYTRRTVWSDGKQQDEARTGIYTNVDSWHIDVVLDGWEDI